MKISTSALRGHFETLSAGLFSDLRAGEHLSTDLVAEDSQYMRLNAARIRQIGTVTDAAMKLSYVLETQPQGVKERRFSECTLSLCGDGDEDRTRVTKALGRLRQETPQLPADPLARLPENKGSVEQIQEGRLLSSEESVARILPGLQGVDLAGIYASGSVVRATANSAGQRQWFYTENFSVDYSLYTPHEKAVKSTFAGNTWSDEAFARDLGLSRELLSHLEKPARKIPRGSYRVYLAPTAFSQLVAMLAWYGISERAIRQGQSPLRLMRSGEKTLSPLFSLTEDFSAGTVPRFNVEGEIAPEKLRLITEGKLENTLVHARTAQEFGVVGNGANLDETFRAPSVSAGTLKQEDILKRLGTGLYLSNLHYLNWSDQFAGRVTGMTRYACLWVENGVIQGPVEALRWDDSLFRFFGSELEDLTDFRATLADVGTYEYRQLGAMIMPGALLRSFQFTL